MKAFKVFFLLFLFFFNSLLAEEFEREAKVIEDFEEYSFMLDLNGIPSGIIGGCVNVVTGRYFEAHDDVSTVGLNCVTASRSFSSGKSSRGDLYDFWDLNLSGKMEVSKDPYSEKISAVVFDRGTPIPFKGTQRDHFLHLDKKILDMGCINVPSPYASGRTHFANKSLLVLDDGKYTLNSGGETLSFKPRGEEDKLILTSVLKSNKCRLKYNYFGKNDTELHSITANSSQGKPSGHLYLRRTTKKKTTLSTDDGRLVTYNFEKQRSQRRGDKKRYRYCLTSVKRNFGPTTKYQYKYTGKYSPELLVRREEPDNRYLNIDYHDAYRRVVALHAPVGVDAAPVLIWKFKYSLPARRADVFDAYGNKKTYSWAGGPRLKKIEEFSSTGELYRAEELIFGKKGKRGIDHTLLQAKTIRDSSGKILFAKTYSYQPSGNITEECIAGNLSGTSTINPEIDSLGKLISNGCETYIKRYKYTCGSLVIYENDGDQIIDYIYYPNTSLIKSKTLSDASGIRQRFYYEYDANGALTLESVDDGNHLDFSNLSGVTERRSKKCQNNNKGLPENVSEFYLDISSNQEVLINKVLNKFTPAGLIKKIEVYDSKNQFAYDQSFVYDSAGKVIEETDAVGVKAFYTYDANGNCILKQTAAADYRKHYDYSNRLIKEEVHADGEILTKSYAYDLRGHKIRATDIYGNETRFIYDSFGRVHKRILPAIQDLDGNLFHPEETFVYNELNHPIQKIDANGFVTTRKLNVHGKPHLVISPQGTVEAVIYNFNGTIKETTSSAGLKTVFEYDFLRRKIREEKFSDQGVSLSVQRWIYNAFHLLQEIDPEGFVTEYSYDGAGRLISETKGEKRTSYIYDTLGRQKEKREFFSEEECRISAIEYDLLNRVIEERIENKAGEIFIKKQFSYDSIGNRTHETVFTNSGPRTTITRYNGFKLPIKVVAPDNTETLYRYCYDYRNERGQGVP